MGIVNDKYVFCILFFFCIVVVLGFVSLHTVLLILIIQFFWAVETLF